MIRDAAVASAPEALGRRAGKAAQGKPNAKDARWACAVEGRAGAAPMDTAAQGLFGEGRRMRGVRSVQNTPVTDAERQRLGVVPAAERRVSAFP